MYMPGALPYLRATVKQPAPLQLAHHCTNTQQPLNPTSTRWCQYIIVPAGNAHRPGARLAVQSGNGLNTAALPGCNHTRQFPACTVKRTQVSCFIQGTWQRPLLNTAYYMSQECTSAHDINTPRGDLPSANTSKFARTAHAATQEGTRPHRQTKAPGRNKTNTQLLLKPCGKTTAI
jgi:hypothetical protein